MELLQKLGAAELQRDEARIGLAASEVARVQAEAEAVSMRAQVLALRRFRLSAAAGAPRGAAAGAGLPAGGGKVATRTGPVAKPAAAECAEAAAAARNHLAVQPPRGPGPGLGLAWGAEPPESVQALASAQV